MIGAVLLFLSALIGAAMCFEVARRKRGQFVRLDWRFFLAMGLGLVAVGFLYIGIAHTNYHGDSVIPFIPYTRILWGFVIFSTALMAYGALSDNDNGKEP